MGKNIHILIRFLSAKRKRSQPHTLSSQRSTCQCCEAGGGVQWDNPLPMQHQYHRWFRQLQSTLKGLQTYHLYDLYLHVSSSWDAGLFHNWAEFGVCTAATRYLISATSMSEWSCKMNEICWNEAVPGLILDWQHRMKVTDVPVWYDSTKCTSTFDFLISLWSPFDA